MIKSRDLALKYHGSEYTEKHLDKVANLAVYRINNFRHELSFYLNYNVILNISYLHDFIEDIKEVSFDDISKQLSLTLEEKAIINALTDPDGKNRKERKIKSYYKIRNSAYPKLTTLFKIYDRAANIQRCIDENNKNLFDMYEKESYSFKCGLWNPELDSEFN